MYKLKSIARRSTALGAAFAVLAAAVVPAAPAFADALNPLTDRSLTLSSSAPGWDNTDGSGNATYAPPNSGANGQKTGNTYEFKVSTDTTSGANVKAMSFQYCTSPAGNCRAPGDNLYTVSGVRDTNAASIASKKSDLEVVIGTADEAPFGTYVTTPGTGIVNSVPAPTTVGDNFLVYYRTSDSGTPAVMTDDTWAASTGWSMAVDNNEIGYSEAAETATGWNNEIRLTNATGQGFAAGTLVRVVFFATNTNYITNPGSGAFFVRINTYNDSTNIDDPVLREDDVIDGGVTVANVMNQSIQITTKVLETMDFSVGTVDPYTLDSTGGATSELYTAAERIDHSTCDPIVMAMDTADIEKNRLKLGDDGAEYSLRTDTTYSTHSYWRLSSNSSAGATVYYSGVTLSNTVGDKIDAIGSTATAPSPGSEQFGLALDNGSSGTYDVNYGVERDSGEVYENAADNDTSGIHSSVVDDLDPDGAGPLPMNASYHAPRLSPMIPQANYGNGSGVINSEYGTIDTSFAFSEASNTIPVPMASEDTTVVDCVTGKVNYIANIAATTPAGIYTTKVNYIAAPQY